ncbi:MAG: PP2C family protein-serine/threonine phosphatase [Gemmatimonadales bacterium]
MSAPRAVSATAASVCGPTRRRNEDMAVLGTHTVRDGVASMSWTLAGATRPFLAGVLDGLGGHQGGDQASARVAERLATTVGRWALDGTVADLTAGLTETLGDARRELEELGRLDPALEGAGTTCTALVAGADAFVLLHVGDTRCYRRRDGLWKVLTVDHAVALPDGRSSAGLTHAVGAGVPALPAELVTDLTDMCWPGDVYLLITDGVLAATETEAALEAAFAAPDARGVLDLALAHGGPDNATAVRLEILE